MCDKAKDFNKFPWTFMKDKISQIMFCDANSDEMTFLFHIPDGEFKIKLKEFIEFCGGKVYSSMNEMDPYTVVLIDLNELGLKVRYKRDLFHIKYIEDCYIARKCLDITPYRLNLKSQINPKFNYMNIIYFKKYTFNSVPQEYLSCNHSTNNEKKENSKQDQNKTNESPVKKTSNLTINNEEEKNIKVQPNIRIESQSNKKIVLENCTSKTQNDIDSNSQSCVQEVTKTGLHKRQFIIKVRKRDNQKCSEQLDSNTEKNDKLSKEFKLNHKNTRLPYSRSEKEAILKYIVGNKLEERVKGNLIWKQMEKDKVCEIRTWMSMREHFLKSLISELSLFKFLTPKQIKDLRFYYSSCNKV
uniref:Telomeric repeat-binding factor 2-interacting protein 1 n=1 Tax=Clastoptera arizonana TaxID=38151 RepID=A0A1B6DZJ7_9HEMI